MLRSLTKFSFSRDATKILKKLNQDFYLKNYKNSFEQKGFPQAELCKEYGLRKNQKYFVFNFSDCQHANQAYWCANLSRRIFR